jgi:hypothetical protein
MRQIRRFGVFQTAKMIGVLYALMGLLFAPIFIIASMFGVEGSPFGIVFALLIPVIYGVLGFIMTAIGAAIYNGVAGLVGGIEVEFAESHDQLGRAA